MAKKIIEEEAIVGRRGCVEIDKDKEEWLGSHIHLPCGMNGST